MSHSRPWWRTRSRIAAAVAIASLATTGVVVASDHQDTPEVELSPRSDINDVYAFPGSSADRTVLAVTTSSPIAGGSNGAAAFDPNLLYQIKIDNTGDGVEDRVIQFTVRGEGSAQVVEMRGPVAPAVTGIRTRIVESASMIRGPINSVINGANGIQLFAGLRDDPFFIDLEQFFRIIPDRKPATGALSMLPETPTASAWRPAGTAVDFLRGLNALAFVVELPTALLTEGGNARIGLWATISR
jgi:hypothetical protein